MRTAKNFIVVRNMTMRDPQTGYYQRAARCGRPVWTTNRALAARFTEIGAGSKICKINKPYYALSIAKKDGA